MRKLSLAEPQLWTSMLFGVNYFEHKFVPRLGSIPIHKVLEETYKQIILYPIKNTIPE